jgi:pyruvate formate lyase activating enzyme
MADIEKDVLFYDESGGGATFSGGEPLMQPAFLAELLRRCRRQGIHTALDTTGHAPLDVFQEIVPLVDLFLYDLKVMEAARHRTYVGVSNRGILTNLRYLAECGREVRIRFPLIPQINDLPENLDAMQTVLRDLGLRQIDILPYHDIHRQKYRRLGTTDRLKALPPAEDVIARVRDHLVAGGFTVRIGG